MAINTGVNVSKLIGYAVLAPEPGVNVTKLVGYAVLDSGNVSPPLWPEFEFAEGFVNVPYYQAWDMPTSAETVSYSVVAGALPDGLSLASVSQNQGKIDGTPTVEDTFNFTLRATNDFGAADKDFTIIIGADPASGAGGGSWTWIS